MTHPLLAVLVAAVLVFPTVPAVAGIAAGPWLQAGTTTSVVVMWESDDERPGFVEFGASRDDLSRRVASKPSVVPASETNGVAEDDAAILHEVKLTGLAPGRRYHYRVGGKGFASDVHAFRTHREAGPLVFLSTSNTHAFARAGERAKMERMARIPVDFVVNQGDQSQQSLNREYREQIRGSAVSASNTVWYTTRGNHENRPWSRYPFWYHNEFPGHRDESYYSFDVADVHFIVLDEAPTRRTFPEKWFRDDVARSGKRWKVVLAKKPPYLFGRTYLYDLFEEAGIDVMLAADCGSRSGRWPAPYEGDQAKYRGVWYLTNCGGYQVVRTAADHWDVETFAADGTRIGVTRVTREEGRGQG